MARSKLRVSQVIALAAERGIFTEREYIGQVSDAVLGDVKVNGQRVWTPAQAEVVLIALELIRRRNYTVDEVAQIIHDRATAAAAIEELRDLIERAGSLVGAA